MPTLQTYNTMEDIERLAEFAHYRQRDRAGYPYIKHPMRVMETVRAQGAAPYVQMAAVLHDITEDTRFTPEILLTLGVPEAAVDIVKLLDRDYSKAEWESIRDLYRKYDDEAAKPIACSLTADEYYYRAINGSPEARMVKLADIADNTQPWRMSYLSEATRERLKAKYAKAHELLGA
jgi:(p)ppGpp synthase/HD superfamily hydrolase